MVALKVSKYYRKSGPGRSRRDRERKLLGGILESVKTKNAEDFRIYTGKLEAHMFKHRYNREEVRSLLKFYLVDRVANLMTDADTASPPWTDMGIQELRERLFYPTLLAVRYFFERMSNRLVGVPVSPKEHELPPESSFHGWLK